MGTARQEARTEEPGYKSSEFWLTLTSMICATVMRGFQLISDEVWLGVVAGGAGIYNINRAFIKR